MSEDNSFIGRNYFEGDGQMSVPPEYFLQRIYDYDTMLVLFPSQVRPGCYIIARRREKSPGLTSAALAAVANPDTRTCMAMGWVPVCAMYQTGISWDPTPIIAKLKARDIWAHGGAEKVADLLEAQEDAEAKARTKALRDDLWNRSGDGWRTYQARTGASSIKFHDNYQNRHTSPLGKFAKTQFIHEAGAPILSPVTGGDGLTAPTPRSTAGLDTNNGVTIGGEV